jgi:multidrug efflux pump subunit AcrA (membrane-fusion protein)
MEFNVCQNAAALALATAMLLTAGCQKPSANSDKPTPPAKVTGAVKEDQLNRVELTEQAEERLGVKLAAVEKRRFPQLRTYGAEVMLPTGASIIVSAPIGGTLQAPSSDVGVPQVGSKVKQGQPVFVLMPLLSPERNVLTPAERINMAQAKNMIATARIDADGQVQQAQVQVDAAQIALDRAERLLREQAGNARAGAPLFEVMNSNHIWIKVPVYAGEAAEIAKKRPAQIASLRNASGPPIATAPPAQAPPSAAPLASAVDFYYELPNPDGRFQPGERLAVRLELDAEQEHLGIPWSAIVQDVYGGQWVYAQRGPHQFERQRVQVRAVQDNWAVLEQGPPADTQVVIEGAAEIFGTEFGFGK